MTEGQVRERLAALAGVRVLIGSEEAGTPQVAWGDTFCFYDPKSTGDQKMPFATIVTNDYPGWDEVSRLSQPGRFRVNLAVGRDYLPAIEEPIDYAAADVVLPHPTYAAQGWVSIVNPGPGTTGRLGELIEVAYARVAGRHRP
ncbi:MAG TPA: DUF6194 family protein [Acidimicrobiia bacterium]